MKQLFYLSVFCAFALTACKGTFKKGDSGLEYKIISGGNGKTLGYGNFMQIHITQVYAATQHTLLMETWDFFPRIQVFDSVSTPLSYYKIMKQLKKGDSLIIRSLTDSIFKDAKLEMPDFMKKGKYLYTHVKLLNIFETPAEADSANNAERLLAKPKIYKKQMEELEKGLIERKPQLEIDSKIIDSFLAKNNIKATKTKWGTYIAVTTEGTGETINSNNIVYVNYTGRTLIGGVQFDSNVDPKAMFKDPYEVNMAELGTVILGWTDALMHLKNGSKATIYVPSSLGYGVAGKGADIKPNENLIFDIEITDVTTEADKMAKLQEAQDKIIESQKRYADSLKKATSK
jgi:FKBP-type peptidyl-prolyl cis-trans isomerase